MRISSKLRISAKLLSVLLNPAIVAGFVGLALLLGPKNETASADAAGQFIEDQLILLEMDQVDMQELPPDARPVIVVPVPGAPIRDASLSDGKFETLSRKWKRGVQQVVLEKRCNKHAQAFQVSTYIDPVLQEAQAIVESNCDAAVIGAAGEVGIFQVMPKTCAEIGIRGDYADPLVNARCTEKYRLTLCAASKKKCTAKLMFLAHNRGISGALRTADAASTQYVRKVDCAARVLRKQKCA